MTKHTYPLKGVVEYLRCRFFRSEKISRLFYSLLLLLFYSPSFSQVLNVTQAGLIENGFGKVPNLTGASAMAVQGNYAYVVGVGNVMEVIDITLPGIPTHKGSISNGEGGASIQRPQAIVVRGNYAYITSYGADALEIIDISNPSKPVHKGVIRDGNGSAPYLKSAWGISLSGNYAYVTSAQSNALEIIDISNPAAPAHKGALLHGDGGAFLTTAFSVHVAGSHAYVGCGGGLEIVDVSNPAVPVHKGKLLDGAGAAPYLADVYGIKVIGNLAYMVSITSNAFEIVDVSNPAQPVHHASLLGGDGLPPYLSSPFSLDISGNYAYVGSFNYFNDPSEGGALNSALEIIDISNSAAPVHAAALKDDPRSLAPTYNSCRSVVLVGTTLYSTSRYSNSITITDVANPLAPKVISQAITPQSGGAQIDNPGEIAVDGNFAFVANSSGIEIIDVTNPSQPQHAATTEWGASSIAIYNKFAYTAQNRASHFFVTDISSPRLPVLKATKFAQMDVNEAFNISDLAIDSESGVLYAALSKRYAQLHTGSQFYIEGIRILPTDPASTGTYGTLLHGTGGALLNDISSVYPSVISGNRYLFVTSVGSNALEIVDVENANAPVHKGKIMHGEGGALLMNPSSVVVSGNYAYVASYGNNAFEIVDVSNPALPVHKGNLTHGQGGTFLEGPSEIAIKGNYALVTCVGTTGDGALAIIDISDPSAPKHYGTLKHGTNGALLDGALGIAISGNYAYITNNGLYQNVDVAYLYGPSLNNFSPTTGPVGTSVTITGQNFNTFFTADVNGVPVDITAITATSLTFTVPPTATNGKITLTYAGQKFSPADNFIVSPTTVTATDIQQNSFTTSWSNVGSNNYYFDLSTDNFTTFVTGYNNLTLGNVTSLDITGLNPATTYQYRVRSSDGTLISDQSNTTSVLTTPATPAANQPAIINQANFTARWTAVTGATNYFIDVATDDAFTKFLVGYNNLSVTATEQSQIVTGLTPFTHYYYRVRAANTTGSSSSSNVITVITLDITAPVISNSIAPNPTTLTFGASPVLNSTITDNVSVDSAQLFYRGISKKSFKKVSMQGPGGLGGNYSITVQPEWYDSLGMEYYFVAKDKAGNKTSGAKSFIQLINPSISIPTLPSGSDQSNYRIIAFPYQVGDNKVTAVYNNVPWNDNTKAGLWWWNPNLNSGAGDYDQYGVSTTLQTIDPGKGYWAITSTPVTPTLSNISAPKYNQSNLYTMTLKPGWNEVGNPYPVPISWDEVIAYNQTINPGASFSPLTIYDATGYKPATGTSQLPAFEGGFVKNLGSSDISIQIPFPGQTIAGGRIAAISADISNEDWNISLRINQNGRTNQLGGFGMHRLAKAGVDRYDNFNPPSFLGIPEINFTNTEYPTLSFSNDMVQSQDNYTWTFTPAGKEGSMTQLVWNNELNGNSSKQLLLLDEEQLTVIDMNAVSQYDFVLTKSSRFRIFYGSEVKITSSRIIASAPFPNPLNDEAKTTINLALPDSGSDYSINMQVYSGQGNVIGSVNKRLTPGIHPLEFSLSPALSGGIYIYKLAVTNEKTSSIHTGKIVKQ